MKNEKKNDFNVGKKKEKKKEKKKRVIMDR